MAHRTIRLKTEAQRQEYEAGAAGIYPGMILAKNSSGQVIPMGTQGGVAGAPLLVAIEDDLIGSTVSTVYSSGSRVQCVTPQMGDTIAIRCVSGATINIGTKVISSNAGKGMATTGSPAQLVGESNEAAGALSADTLVSVTIA